jgi:hypothetical protein
MASITGLLSRLVKEEGAQGALQALKSVQPGIRSLEEASEEALSKLLATKGYKRTGPTDASPEELSMFARSVEQGSDVAKPYREGGGFDQISSVSGEQQARSDMSSNFDVDITPASLRKTKYPGTDPLVLSDETSSPNPASTISSLKSKIAGATALGGAGAIGAAMLPDGQKPGEPSPVAPTPGATVERTALAEVPAPEEEVKPKTLAGALGGKPKQTAPAVGKEEAKLPTEEETLLGRLSAAEKKYEKAKESADYGELMSTLARSLTQIGAAYSGMKSGADMSGVANKVLTDWDKRRDQIFQEYKTTLGDIRDQQKELSRQKERTQDREDKKAIEQKNYELKKDEQAQREKWNELNHQLKILQIGADQDTAAAKNQIAAIEDELQSYEKEMNTLAQASKLALNPKKKDAEIAGEIQELLRVRGIPVTKKGTFFGESPLSRDDLKTAIEEQRQRLEPLIVQRKKDVAYLRRVGAKSAQPASQEQTVSTQPNTPPSTPNTPPATPPPAGGLTPQQAKRLQELKAKAAGGQ